MDVNVDVNEDVNEDDHVMTAALSTAGEIGTTTPRRLIPPPANRTHRTRTPTVTDRRDPCHIHRQIRGTEDPAAEAEGQSPAAIMVKTSTNATNIGMDLVAAKRVGVQNEGVQVIIAHAAKNHTRGADAKLQ